MAESAIKPACLYFQSATEDYKNTNIKRTNHFYSRAGVAGGSGRKNRWKKGNKCNLFCKYGLDFSHSDTQKFEYLIQAKSRPKKKISKQQIQLRP